MSLQQPFAPVYGTNQVITPAAASATVTLTATGVNSTQLRVVNTGAAIGYFRTDVAANSPVATTADVPVPAGMSTTITKPYKHDTIATISATGTTFQVMAGEGA